eukprot:2104192-Rhodomonas_salina.6
MIVVTARPVQVGRQAPPSRSSCPAEGHGQSASAWSTATAVDRTSEGLLPQLARASNVYYVTSFKLSFFMSPLFLHLENNGLVE